MPRGRPKGSKNKVNSKSEYVIGDSGKRYQFPIVRTGTVRKHTAMLYVNDESFKVALARAIRWAMDYSEGVRANSRDGTEEFWPLVNRLSTIPDRRHEKVYVRRLDNESAYIEANDYGCWITVRALETIS